MQLNVVSKENAPIAWLKWIRKRLRIAAKFAALLATQRCFNQHVRVPAFSPHYHTHVYDVTINEWMSKDASAKPVPPACAETNSHDQGQSYYGQNSNTAQRLYCTPDHRAVSTWDSTGASSVFPVLICHHTCNTVSDAILQIKRTGVIPISCDRSSLKGT